MVSLVVMLCSLMQMSSQTMVSGLIMDTDSGAPLPFATIRLTQVQAGATSNAKGEFSFTLKEEWLTDTLQFSFIGYSTVRIPVIGITSPLTVYLDPVSNELREVIVRPLSAKEQIVRSMRKVPMNYAKEPYNSRSYYRQVIRENSSFIDHSEAVFLTYHESDPRQRTNHQLLLYRETQDLQDVAFMRKKLEKRRARRAIKEGERDTVETEKGFIKSTFGGPGLLLTYDVQGTDILYLDTNKLYQFRYEYGPESSHEGRDLLSILFESKGAIENARRWGKILIDTETDAIVAIQEEGNVVIPALVKSALIVLGLRIKKPSYRAELRYLPYDGRWFPELIRWDLDLGLVKTRLFKANERSNFFLEQLMHVDEFTSENPIDIVRSKRFDPEKEMKDQVYGVPGLDWSLVDVIP